MRCTDLALGPAGNIVKWFCNNEPTSARWDILITGECKQDGSSDEALADAILDGCDWFRSNFLVWQYVNSGGCSFRDGCGARVLRYRCLIKYPLGRMDIRGQDRHTLVLDFISVCTAIQSLMAHVEQFGCPGDPEVRERLLQGRSVQSQIMQQWALLAALSARISIHLVV